MSFPSGVEDFAAWWRATVEKSEWGFRDGRNVRLVMRLRRVEDEFDEERINALMN
jgi:hypothetical protein